MSDGTRKASRPRRTQELLSLLSGTVAAITAGVAVAAFVGVFPGSRTSERRFLEVVDESIAMQRSELASVRVELEDLRSVLDSLASLPPDAPVAPKLGALEQRVESVGSRVGALESALLENPSKALAVPLIRKDLDNLSATYRADLAATRAAIDRVYDLNKWFIGLMITMAVGILGLAIGNLVTARRSAE